MKRVGRVIILVLGLLGSTVTFAQNLSQHNWYFGNSNEGIRFNRTTNVATLVNNQANPFGTGGSAVATDPGTADLLFYSDGNTIFDVTHTPMPNGSGLSGAAASNQPVAICSVPGQPGKYFVFVNSAVFPAGGNITVTTVDMALFGTSTAPSPPFGDVMLGLKDIPIVGLNNRAEGMIIVPDDNGVDFWLITQQINSTSYTATHINAASFTGGTFVNSTSSTGTVPITVANFAYHAASGRLAVSAQDPSTDAVILNFNDISGAFTTNRTIFNTGRSTTSNQSIYDIEWDPNGQYLYISRTGEAGLPADVLQYDYVNSDPLLPSTILSPVLTTPVFRSWGLQLAPDSSIYYLYQATAGGPFLVDTFTNTDTIASEVRRNTTPLGTSDFNGTQFPSFLPKARPNLTASFTVSGSCQNNPTAFYPVVSPNADSLRWRFGDGADTTLWSPVHTYVNAGSFTASLTAYYLGDSVVVTNPVTINAFPLQLDLVQDTTACQCALPVNAPLCPGGITPFTVTVDVTGGTATSYVWSNGDVGPDLTPDSAGFYYVVVSDGSGCSAYADVNVKEHLQQDQRQNIWYFGNNAGIDFNVSPPIALDNSAMLAPEGCAIVCDNNGQTIFYTNGDQVFDRRDIQIDVGIGGDPGSTQSSLIIPVPDDETLYYIFTTEEIAASSGYQAKYSLFDLKQNSGFGLVTQKNIPLFARSTERITGNDNWVIFHEYGNNSFRAYPISGAGIGLPVITAIGSDHQLDNQPNAEGYMKLGPRNELAVAVSTGAGNFIELFHFNDTTGVLSDFRRIDLNQTSGQVYGIEFSASGNKLFATITGAPTASSSLFYEYFLDSIENVYPSQPPVTIAAVLGAIQIAPTGQVFVAASDPAHNGFLSLIQVVEDTTAFSTFQLNNFPLDAGTSSTLGLPNFRQQINNAFGGPDFTVTGLCLGDSTKFAGQGRDELDQFGWDFGDGSGLSIATNNPSPSHVYATAGTYTVTMFLKSTCPDPQISFAKQITIHAKPSIPTINPPQSLCNGPVILDANSGVESGITYFWSTGDTTRMLSINQQVFISVTNTNKFGCSSSDSTVIGDARPLVDLGFDQTVCEGFPVSALTANNPPGTIYSWTINGASTGNPTSTQTVDTSIPNSPGTPQYLYSVTATFPAPSNCSVTDEVAITVTVNPTFTLTGTDPSTCLGSDGSLTVQLNPSAPAGGPLYSYFVTGPSGFNQQGVDQVAPATIVINGLQAGQPPYTAVITDQISGCTVQSNFGLTDATFTANANVPPACDPLPIQITSTATQFPLQYSATENGTGQITSGTSGTANFATSPVTGGVYTVVLTDNLGCTRSINNVTVTPSPPATITITPAVCGSPPTLTASGASTYSWVTDVPGSIAGATNGATIQLVPGTGTPTFTVTGTPAVGCAGTENFTVDLQIINADFSQSNQCEAPVILTATPNGSFVYSWTLNGSPLPTGGQQIVATVTGNYAVAIFNPGSNCTHTSAPKTVTVNEILVAPTIAVNPSPPCDDGLPFTLTATTTSTGVTYSWTLDGVTISGADTPVITQTASGNYVVSITKTVACPPLSGAFPISRIPLPIGALPDRAIICNDPENADTATSHVLLNPGSFESYNWFKNDLTLSFTEQVLDADSEGEYRVDLTNSFGCTASDIAIVENLCIPKIVAPTAFRPGSNLSDNREFYVFSYFITDEFQVFIYNRWGELIFQSGDRYFRWNGSLNNTGNLLPGGTYAYVIKFRSSFEPEKGTQEKHGGVVLVR